MTEASLILDLGQCIKKCIKEKNKSVREVSKKTGLTEAQIYAYMRGAIWPSARNLSRLLNGLNVTIYQLVRGQNEESIFSVLRNF